MNFATDLPLWLTEDVTWPVLWGLLLIGVFAVFWFVTKQFRYLFAALAVVALLVLAMFVELSFETDKELLIHAVYVMAEAVRNNDAEGIVQFTRAENENLANRIRRDLDRIDVYGCRINGFNKVEIDPADQSPQKARIGFAAWGTAALKGHSSDRQQGIVRVELEFEKSGGKWTVEASGYQPSISTKDIQLLRE